MTRREALTAASLAAVAANAAAQSTPISRKGRITQSACRWCYNKIPIEDFAKECARLGVKAVDLAADAEVPMLQKYGLVPTVLNGGHSIETGLNRKETHEERITKMKERIDFAKQVGAPSIIVFSGNRKGMPDSEGLDNCAEALKQVTKYAEDKNVLIVMELLNSKVNHKDYMCDHTKWGADLVQKVGSSHFKLLYDIYHMQIMEGDIIRNIRDFNQYIGHYHTGGNPGRNEIDTTQELYYPAIVRAIIETNFKGYMAHEFIPKRDALKSLAEAVELCDV